MAAVADWYRAHARVRLPERVALWANKPKPATGSTSRHAPCLDALAVESEKYPDVVAVTEDLDNVEVLDGLSVPLVLTPRPRRPPRR